MRQSARAVFFIFFNLTPNVRGITECYTHLMQNLILETPFWIVKLNEDQQYLGRSTIVLKRDCGALSDLTQEEGQDFLTLVKRLETLLKTTFNATMFNWTCLMNDSYKSTPPDPQVHWHVRPRYDHPVEFAGETFTDPNFAHHYLRGREDKKVLSEELFEKVVLELKKGLS